LRSPTPFCGASDRGGSGLGGQEPPRFFPGLRSLRDGNWLFSPRPSGEPPWWLGGLAGRSRSAGPAAGRGHMAADGLGLTPLAAASDEVTRLRTDGRDHRGSSQHTTGPDRLVDGTASQVDDSPMRQAVRIEARTEADALCIRDALIQYQPQVDLEDAGWVVGIPEPQDLSVVLEVLRSCLDDNGIAMVKVTLGDHSYLMQGSLPRA
jgi:hypothetical protein